MTILQRDREYRLSKRKESSATLTVDIEHRSIYQEGPPLRTREQVPDDWSFIKTVRHYLCCCCRPKVTPQLS